MKTNKWQSRLQEIIFEADTRAGKIFDICLIITILLSVITVMLDSVNQINLVHGQLLTKLEWIFTIIFTVEYILR